MELDSDQSRWIWLDSVDSTNTYLREGRFASGTICLAGHQAAGRGRGDHRWFDAGGSSFLFSGLLEIPTAQLPPDRMLLVPLLAGIALLRGVEAAWREFAPRIDTGELSLKWPNDLYLTREGSVGKLAGVLVESSISGERIRLIIGMGLNWSGVPQFAATTKVPPRALFSGDEFETGREAPRPIALTPHLVREFNARVGQLGRSEPPPFLAEIRDHFYLRHRHVSHRGLRYRVENLNDRGGLVLENIEDGKTVVLYDVSEELLILE